MKSKNILIVEDEVLIAEGVKIYLEDVGYVVAEIAISYEQAIGFIKTMEIDLVLLDIRLYGKRSGIELAEYLNQESMKIPFVYLTSQYDKRILEHALETNPFGYLVKPIQKHTLYTTIETTFNKIQSNKIVQIKCGKVMHNVQVNQIMYIKSEHVYCEIFLHQKATLLTRCSLSNLLELFESEKIVKCHRSYVINTSFVGKWDNNGVVMLDNEKIPISKSYKESVLNALEKKI